uniref:Uncharacterized protein n=1 Tax=Panagrolaimus davidi TaxID=227884 RepID=A0A914PHX0_9BILA
MQFCYIFSICVFLLISLPLFDAFVTCPFGKTDQIIKGDEKGEANCSTSCAVYSCVGIVNNVTIEIHNTGCTEDFVHDCAVFDTSIKFINATSPHEMNYFNGNVTYVSGCGDEEKDAHHCIMKKSANFLDEIAEKQKDGSFKNGEIITDVKDVVVVTKVTGSSTNITDFHPASTADTSTEKHAPIVHGNDTIGSVISVIPSENGTDVLLGPDPVIITSDKKDSTVAPPTTSETTPASVARSSRISTSKTATATPTSKSNDSSTLIPDLKDDDNGTFTVAPAPASSTSPTDTSASNGQDGSFWKKIRCFTICLILAAWI